MCAFSNLSLFLMIAENMRIYTLITTPASGMPSAFNEVCPGNSRLVTEQLRRFLGSGETAGDMIMDTISTAHPAAPPDTQEPGTLDGSEGNFRALSPPCSMVRFKLRHCREKLPDHLQCLPSPDKAPPGLAFLFLQDTCNPSSTICCN